MAILHLTLTKQWFDMIESGEKTEEYREIKPYWIKRLLDCNYPEEEPGENKVIPHNIHYDIFENCYHPDTVLKAYRCTFKKFDGVIFKNGYSGGARMMSFKKVDISIGKGNPSWGAGNSEPVFVLRLAEKV